MFHHSNVVLCRVIGFVYNTNPGCDVGAPHRPERARNLLCLFLVVRVGWALIGVDALYVETVSLKDFYEYRSV